MSAKAMLFMILIATYAHESWMHTRDLPRSRYRFHIHSRCHHFQSFGCRHTVQTRKCQKLASAVDITSSLGMVWYHTIATQETLRLHKRYLTP